MTPNIYVDANPLPIIIAIFGVGMIFIIAIIISVCLLAFAILKRMHDKK